MKNSFLLCLWFIVAREEKWILYYVESTINNNFKTKSFYTSTDAVICTRFDVSWSNNDTYNTGMYTYNEVLPLPRPTWLVISKKKFLLLSSIISKVLWKIKWYLSNQKIAECWGKKKPKKHQEIDDKNVPQ